MTGESRPAIGDFPAGAQIAGYQIQELLGRGGMAVVYRAADVRLDRQVALKVLAPELTRDSAFRQRFIRESRSGASVDHPNIIPVFEAGEAEGVLFIAMRYVAGRDVRALLDRSGPLPPARAVNIITQVASALDAAHARGLVHRDVKPANMLLGAVGSGSTPDHVYLSDFGLSKLSASAVSLTSTGQFLGTIDYMSPEQVEGRPTDGRTDLYALGCAAFEMLTGRPPFQRDQDLAVMWAQVSAPPPSAHELRPDLPAAVDQALAKALAKSSENRQASCLEFAAELRAACALGSGRGQRGAAAGQGVPTELAAAVRQAPAATELAMGAIGAAGTGQPSASPGPGTPLAGGLTPPGGGLTPPGGATPASEATITEAVQGVGGGPRPVGSARGPARGPAPGATTPDPYGGYGPPEGHGSPGGGYGSQGGYGSRSGYGPPGQTDQLWGSGSGSQPPGYQGPPQRRNRALPFLLGLLVIAVLVGAGLLVLHLRGNGNPHSGPTTPVKVTTTPPSSPASSPPTSPVAPTTPRGVVTAYYHAINNRDYATAYGLNSQAQANETYAQFKQGYSDTEHDSLTITGVSGDTVSIALVAQHTDGTILHFSGTYTVQNGKIVGSDVRQTS